MGQHFLLHRELVAATAVHHAVVAHLSSDAHADLVVVSPQALRIYRVEPFPTAGAAATHPSATESAAATAPFVPKGHVLHLIDSFPLAGVAESAHVLHFDQKLLRKRNRFHGGRDVLLLSFARYKWVVVGYDRRARSLATLAMYSFTEDAIGPGATLKGERNGREQLLGLSTHAAARVDPQTRCAAMLIYSNQLVVVPFRSGSMELSVFDEDDDEDDGESESGESGGRRRATADDDDDDDDDEEQKLQELVNETKQRGGATTDVNSRLLSILDKSVKIGTKRKRNQLAGLLPDELTGREFLLRLPELEIAGKVIDLAFLDGYLEPTLMVLHEENGKNATDGRLAAGYDTYCLTVISINLNTRLHPKIWSVKNLPSDCFQLIPCKAPVGGAVVLSANAFLYFNQTQFHGLATNAFAAETVTQAIFPLAEALYETEDGRTERLNLLLHECHVEYLGHKEILLTMPTGDLYGLALPCDDMARRSGAPRALGLSLRKIHSGAVASCICVDDAKKTVFIGSRSGDSVLYALQAHKLDSDDSGEAGVKTESAEAPSAAHEASGGLDAAPLDVKVEATAADDEDDEDDLFLYGSAAPATDATDSAVKTEDAVNGDVKMEDAAATSAAALAVAPELEYTGRYRYELEQVDVLPSIGQITSIELGVETNADSNEKREELVVSGGCLRSGAVSVLHNGLRPIVGTEAELTGCRAMWTVASSLPTAMKSDDGRAYNSYLILSVAQRTMVLRTGEGMEPLEEDSGFYTSGPTLAAANLFNKQRIVQIFRQGARVMTEVPVESDAKGDGAGASAPTGEQAPNGDATGGDDDEETDDEDDGPRVKLVCTQEITLEGDIECGGMNVDTSKVGIVSVDIIDPYILLLLTDGSIRVLMGDEDDMELTVLDPEIKYSDGMGTGHAESATALGISSVCLFYDWAGMFQDNAWGEEETDKATQYGTTPRKSKLDRANGDGKVDGDDDDDDEMDSLYSAKPKRRASLSASGTARGTSAAESASAPTQSASIPLLLKKDAAMMCGLCYEDGSLHIYSLPDFTKKGVLPYLTFAPQWLVNTMEHYQESQKKRVAFSAPVLGLNASSASANDGRIKKSHTINSPVADIAIHRVGPSEGQYNAQYFARMVLLVFLANGDLLMYAATPKVPSALAAAPGASPPVSFQFARVGTDLITRPFLPLKSRHGTSHNESGANSEANTSAVIAKLRAGFRYPMLTRFENVNNMSGAFFRGAHPMWIVSERGLPSFVPMCVAVPPPPPPPSGAAAPPRVTVPVLSFTPFHHWNCPNGFIYFHSSGALRVCELPSSKTTTLLPSSGGFVLRKAEFGATIHHMLYLGSHGPGGVSEALETPTFAVVCSTKMSPADAERATENPDAFDETDAGNGEDAEAAGGNVMAPTAEMFPDYTVENMVHTDEDVYELRLVQTNEFGDWERNGVFRVHFERYEVVLSVKVMYLYDSSLMREDVASTSREWNAKKRPYVVVGTGYVGPYGEDESGRGRLLLYELDYAQYVNHSGSTSGKLPKLKLVFIKEHRQGAISSVAQLGPYVIAAIGSKLIVYEFKSEQLIGCAFYDAQMYIVSISIVKDFVMYGDVYKSVHFLRWKEKQRQLVLLAKDYEPLAVSATEYNLFEKRLALLAVDMDENLHVMQFAPNDIESRGGQRLLRTGDFHLGVQISSMFRKRVSPSASAVPTAYVNLLGSSEGSIGALVPVTERVFRRLFTLQNVMINTLPQNCALNPREFRALKSNSQRRSGRVDAWSKQKWKKSFLDAHVLFRFLQLDYVAQKEVTRCIGTTPEVVVHNLLEVQRATASFL